ncbi:hypothetical protein V8J36_18410 [Frigidibacter sp. MR17.14]|uniref:hypothetical protein n=1 Tax=Frigidibacter sp. MR17.14 TaxID=3126509 RepID=UPI003012EB7B
MVALYEVLGELEAERRIAASVEIIALRLIDLRELVASGRVAGIVPMALSVAEEAAGLGLSALAGAGRALALCAAGRDSTATLAVLARTLRLGEQALGDILGGASRG